jgi:hypothetical protein
MKACETCGRELSKRCKRFCSKQCRGKSDRKPIDLGRLRTLVSMGATGESMAQQLGTSSCKVRRDLRRLGIYRYWTQRRYKKAAA